MYFCAIYDFPCDSVQALNLDDDTVLDAINFTESQETTHITDTEQALILGLMSVARFVTPIMIDVSLTQLNFDLVNKMVQC